MQHSAWTLARDQHGVVSRAQLLRLGLNSDAIHHRIQKGRLYPVHAGVYAVGRPELTRLGTFMAAVLACGDGAAVSHGSAAGLLEIRRDPPSLHVTVPGAVRRRPGITIHRRAGIEITTRHAIPVTTPAETLIDLAATLTRFELEAAINEADKRDLIGPEALRRAVDTSTRRPGIALLRLTLDIRTFRFQDSDLERFFLPIVRRVGLPIPLTQQRVNGYLVDFFWPDLGLLVETDGLRYHRTPAAQAADRRRDQAHTAAGLTLLRFTHGQIRYEPAYVEEILTTVARRLTVPRARV